MKNEPKHVEQQLFNESPAESQVAVVNAQLRQFLLNTQVIFLMLKGPELTIAFVNQALLNSWNKDWDILGKKLLDVLPELESQRFPNLLLGVMVNGIPYNGTEEKAVLVKNGVSRDVYYNHVYQPIKEDDGTIAGVYVMATDVTEQVINRKKIEQSEGRFRALVTAASNVVYRMNPDWSEMRELEGRGFISDTAAPDPNWLHKYIHPGDQPRVLEMIRKAVSSKTFFEMEHQVVRTDGTLGWTFSRAVPILDENGNIEEWFGTATDITDRKRTEAALMAAREASEAQKRLYETITANTPDLVYVFDTSYHFTYANTALLNMWGKSWDQAIGRKLLENGYEPWHAEMHEREIDYVVATKQSIRGTVSFPHATLGKRIYDYIFVPVLNSQGEVEAIAGTTRDITEINQTADELQRMVDERTKELQRSNEDLQQFAHVASHDLKEPVRKIRTFNNRIRDEFNEELPAKVQDYLGKIERSAERMASMINGVLRYSTVNAMDAVFEAVDLNTVIRNVESDLELVIHEKQAAISHVQLPIITGSSVLLHQLFYNLINNSLKFSVTGKQPLITIDAMQATAEEVKAARLATDKLYQKITLQDNGIGFDQKDAARIFQSFSRLHSRDVYEGTGLGLALCKKIAERHSGAIYAQSEPGKGTQFIVLLPQP